MLNEILHVCVEILMYVCGVRQNWSLPNAFYCLTYVYYVPRNGMSYEIHMCDVFGYELSCMCDVYVIRKLDIFSCILDGITHIC